MPHTINGIGTWYWGKDHLHAEKGTCPFCSGFTDLKSYDTTLYFVVFYIPVIPLGKKRVLFDCAACRKHRVMPLAEWNNQKKTRMRELTEHLRNHPEDIEARRQVLEAFVQFQDKAGFLAAARGIRESMTDDPDLLRSLANGYEFARDLPQATEMIERIHALEGTFESQEMLGRILLLQVRPEEAAPYFEHLLAASDETKAGFLVLLVNAWQAKAQHDRALEVLNRMEPLYPVFARGKEFKKLHKLSTKNRAKGKAVRSPLFEEAGQSGKHSALSGRFAKFAFPAVLALGALVWMGVSWFKGEHQQFYLVSGLEKPYSVEIDKQPYTLQPGQVLPIELAEGKHELKTPGLASSTAETLELSRSFWGRVFDGNVYVINPDRAALLARTRMVYSTKQAANEKKMPDPALYSGKVFYSLSGIDYPFAPFPETIDLPSSTSSAIKSRLLLMDNLSVDTYATTVRKLLGDKVFFEMIQRRLVLEPDRIEFLNLLVALQNEDETIAFLKPGLGAKPLRVEWHRAYQALQQRKGNGEALLREYRDLLAENQNDGGAWYLVGRLVEDDQEAMEDYRKAVEAQPPCAYAYFAMAYRDLCRGDYDKSLEAAEKAVALNKGNSDFRDVAWQAALGLRKWDELLGILAPLRSKSPDSVELAAQEIRVDLRQGDAAKAKRVQNAYLRNNPDLSPADRKMIGLYFDSLFSYAEGDVKAYAEKVLQLDSEQWRIEAAVCEGKAAEALQACKDWGESCPPSYQLMTYVLAAGAHDDKTAGEALQMALATLKKGGENGVAVARLLETPGSADPSTLQHLTILPEDKSVMAAALGLANPSSQKECFEMARRFNIGMTFPSLPLDKILARQVAVPDQGGAPASESPN